MRIDRVVSRAWNGALQRGQGLSRRFEVQLAAAAIVMVFASGALTLLIDDVFLRQPVLKPLPQPALQVVTPPPPPPAPPSKPNDAAPRRSIDVGPPFISTDAITLTVGDQTLVLQGLETPPGTASCLDRDGNPWACGLQARAALHNLLQGRSMRCVETSRRGERIHAVECQLDGRDLGALLAAAGWARASDPSGAYAGETEAARAQSLGIWNGGWRIRQPR